ncbi:MAG TPA: 50S ribosomal protein L25 [Rhabdochlamydiaceae bacterium]|nr:50S ribosomal protein L25 [Rhabdochlamydiaceae bacterium]
MQLTAKPRAEETKGGLKQMRRAGTIPAVLYSPNNEAQSLTIERVELETAFRKIKEGMLSTSVFKLNLDKGKKKAIVKDVQYHPTNYKVLHLDFEELSEDVPVRINVPIILTGVMDCIGVKLGGFLRQVLRTIKVECLPKHIPTHFEIDVRDLAVGKTLKLSDLTLPAGVKGIYKSDQVMVLVSKK